MHLREISLDFSTWSLYKTVTPFRILGAPVKGLVQECYQRELNGEVVSAGVFTFQGKRTHVAWGVKSDPHCSYHALAASGEGWGVVVDGCPEYRVLRLEERLAGFSVDGVVYGTGVVQTRWESLKFQLKQFAPLALFFSLAFVWATLKNIFYADFSLGHVHTSFAHQWMLDFMGGFFLLFGALKALSLRKFAISFSSYDPVARRLRWWGYVYPFIELAIGILYTLRMFLPAVHVTTAAVMFVGSIGIYQKLRSKEEVRCACLGGFFDLPLTWVTFAENLLMALMAVYMLLQF